jgi:hypothetical protein
MKTMSEHNTDASGGYYGSIMLVASWIFTFISSFSVVPMILSSIVSILGAVHYIILIRKNSKK